MAVIPARGGSKGIPRKNIKLLAGKPLIAWTIAAALSSRYIDTVIVTTEDDEIAEIAVKSGAQVPFMRPLELAGDDTPGIEPVLHVLQNITDYDDIILLQPTSPLRSGVDIDTCVDLRKQLEAPAIVSVCKPDKHPQWMYQLGDDQRLSSLMDNDSVANRQELSPVYALNGAIYLASLDFVNRNRTFMTDDTVAYIMPPERSVDLDTPLDWKLAELLIRDQL